MSVTLFSPPRAPIDEGRPVRGARNYVPRKNKNAKDQTLPDGLICPAEEMTWHIEKRCHQAIWPTMRSSARPTAPSSSPPRVIENAHVTLARSHARPHRPHTHDTTSAIYSAKNPPPSIASSTRSASSRCSHRKKRGTQHARAGFRCLSRSLLARAEDLVHRCSHGATQ